MSHPDETHPMSATATPPRPGTHPIGHLVTDEQDDGPDRLPTLDEFRRVERERCRHKLAASRTKALAADVLAAFGDAARPVLAAHWIAVEDDGTIRSTAEEEIDDDWKAIVAVMHEAHGAALKLPCDTRVDRATGRVVVTPFDHEAHVHA